jgi:hypothetical protein
LAPQLKVSEPSAAFSRACPDANLEPDSKLVVVLPCALDSFLASPIALSAARGEVSSRPMLARASSPPEFNAWGSESRCWERFEWS